MTPYNIQLSPIAQQQILTLAPKQRAAFLKIAESLAFNPRPLGAEKITGMIGLYQLPLETVRLIYKIEEQEILLLKIKP